MRHTSDASYIYRGNLTSAASGAEARACNCMGPRPGDPVFPCMMPAYLEREAGKRALNLMGELYRTGKPRFRIKAGSRVVSNA